MAGKHQQIGTNPAFDQPTLTTRLDNMPPVFPGTPVDRAYCEGREAGTNLENPFPITDVFAYNAFAQGAYTKQFAFANQELCKIQSAVD